MKKKKRIKLMDNNEFLNVMARNWERKELAGNAVPNFITGLVREKKNRIYASGTTGLEAGKYNSNFQRWVVGGLKVFRDATQEPEPYNWNADDYLIWSDNATGTQLMVTGPFKPRDHWLKDIPSGFKNVETYYYHYPKCPKCGIHLNLKTNSCDNCGWNIL